MNLDEEINESQKHIRKLIEENMPEMDKFFNEQAISASPAMLKGLKQFVRRNKLGILEGELQLSVVLDTNTLFSCVHRKMIHGKESILVSIAKNPFVTIYYSDYVKEELIRNINKGRLDSKKNTVNKEEAIKYGESILDIFERVPDEEIKTHPNADALRERDPNDVPIINLTCSRFNHGLLTRDKDFDTMEGVEKWSIPEMGNTTCLMNKGTMTLFLTDLSINLIKEVLKLVVQIVRQIVVFVIEGFRMLIQGLKSLPKELYWILGTIALAGIIAYFSTDSTRKFNKLMDDIEGFIRKTGESLEKLFDKIIDLLNRIASSEEFEMIAKGAGYLVLTNLELKNEVDRLEEIAIDFTKED